MLDSVLDSKDTELKHNSYPHITYNLLETGAATSRNTNQTN